MAKTSNVPEQETMIQLLTVLFPKSTIYLYGSRARGTHTERSDINIAIDLGRKMELREIEIARGVLDGLMLPQTIDIWDYQRESTNRGAIEEDGIIWKK
jgi:predicted nucleotidyltransferase